MQSNLFQFRAGRMSMNGTTVSADKRKGYVQIFQSTADDLMHFVWKERTSNTNEIDLIIFPDEATFKRVTQCTTGRVYLLELAQTKKRYFFWSQEPNEEKDAEIETKVNQLLNPPPDNQQASIQQQLLALVGRGIQSNATSSSSATTTSSNTATTQPIQIDLAEILRNIRPPQQGRDQTQTQQPAQGQGSTPVLTPEVVLPFLSNPVIAVTLRPFLPEEIRSTQDLTSLAHNPQLQQALENINSVLQSDNASSLLGQLNLEPSAASGVLSFFQAIQRQTEKENSEEDKRD